MKPSKILDKQSFGRKNLSVTIRTLDSCEFEIHTFDNLRDENGFPISIKVLEHQKEGIEAAKQAGKNAAQSLKELFKS